MAYVVVDDDDYFIYRTPKMSYILPQSDFKYLPRLYSKSHQAMSLYESEFGWVLDERTSLVVTSNKNQIANAFATTVPNNMVVFYKGGIDFLDESAASSWIDTLTSHEISHVYQLDVKNSFGSTLKTVFGNQPYLVLPFMPVPIFISPTLTLPTFLVEGNAVLNESKVNQGGRLFSGEYRALATELVNSGQADLAYIMNSSLQFPYGSDKYIIGGYFQSSLARKYDFKTINRFFRNHAENNIIPFDLKSSFAATYFADYEDLYSQFLKEFKEMQRNYVAYAGDYLTLSLQNIEFSRINDSIYFLSVPDGINPKNLNRFVSDSKIFTAQPSDLKMGKVFKLGDTFVSAASDNNSRHTLYTLLDENENYKETYANKFVTDINGSFISYFDMTDSFDKGSLYRNQEKIADTESKALLDDKGNVFYFKQQENEKVLYKNQERMASINGHYARLTDVMSENEIYFISNSGSGSSLYCFCSGHIERVLPYDNVISAMKAADGFLISFQTSDSYRVAFVSQKIPTLEIPATPSSNYPEQYFKPNVSLTELNAPAIPERYFSLQELRFSTYDFKYFFSETHHTLVNAFNWTDPLFYSNVNLVFSLSDQLALNSLGFDYSPYSTHLSFAASNETHFYLNDTRKLTTSSAQLGASNTLYEKKFHSITAGLSVESEKNELFQNDLATVKLNYQYLESYFLNYLPFAYFSITPFLERSGSRLSQSYQMSGTKMILDDFYISGNFAQLDSEYYKLDADIGKKNPFKKGFFTPVYLASFYTSKLTQSDFEILCEIPISKYYYRFPISLRRIAPFIGFQRDYSDEFFYNTEIREISFATVGVETELLLFHSNPVRLRLLSTDITIQDRTTTNFNVQFKSNF